MLLRVKERNTVHTVNRRKDNWIGYSLRRNFLLKQSTGRKIQNEDTSDGKTNKKR